MYSQRPFSCVVIKFNNSGSVIYSYVLDQSKVIRYLRSSQWLSNRFLRAFIVIDLLKHLLFIYLGKYKLPEIWFRFRIIRLIYCELRIPAALSVKKDQTVHINPIISHLMFYSTLIHDIYIMFFAAMAENATFHLHVNFIHLTTVFHYVSHFHQDFQDAPHFLPY